MVGDISFKVCGLKRVEEAEAAAQAGADFLGFVFYPPSPRFLSLQDFDSLRERLPDLPRVAVCVAPSLSALAELVTVGFDYFQIHFVPGPASNVAHWSSLVGKSRLWLAPKQPPGAPFDETLLDHADTFLWDAYKKGAGVYGGTGSRSDWAAYRTLRERYPRKRWILAGGLNPENAREAIDTTGATILDFNSGLESEPGRKDPARILRVKESLSSGHLADGGF